MVSLDPGIGARFTTNCCSPDGHGCWPSRQENAQRGVIIFSWIDVYILITLMPNNNLFMCEAVPKIRNVVSFRSYDSTHARIVGCHARIKDSTRRRTVKSCRSYETYVSLEADRPLRWSASQTSLNRLFPSPIALVHSSPIIQMGRI